MEVKRFNGGGGWSFSGSMSIVVVERLVSSVVGVSLGDTDVEDDMEIILLFFFISRYPVMTTSRTSAFM